VGFGGFVSRGGVYALQFISVVIPTNWLRNPHRYQVGIYRTPQPTKYGTSVALQKQYGAMPFGICALQNHTPQKQQTKKSHPEGEGWQKKEILSANR
jgi:hypothetical protein